MRWLKDHCWPVLWRTIKEWQADDGNRLAASLAYYAVLSLFPLLLCLISAFGFVQRSWPQMPFTVNVVEFIEQETSETVANQLKGGLDDIQRQAGLGGAVGAVILLLAAMGIFSALEDSLYKIWKVANAPHQGGIWRVVLHVLLHRLKAFVMLFALGAMLVVTFLAMFVLDGIRGHVQNWPIPPVAWEWLQLGVGWFVNAVFFTLAYKLLAKGPAKWEVAALGGALAAFAWELGRMLLAQFLVGSKYNPYGIVGALIAVMLWFYYASTILLFGAELVQVVTRRRQEALTAATTMRSD